MIETLSNNSEQYLCQPNFQAPGLDDSFETLPGVRQMSSDAVSTAQFASRRAALDFREKECHSSCPDTFFRRYHLPFFPHVFSPFCSARRCSKVKPSTKRCCTLECQICCGRVRPRSSSSGSVFSRPEGWHTMTAVKRSATYQSINIDRYFSVYNYMVCNNM